MQRHFAPIRRSDPKLEAGPTVVAFHAGPEIFLPAAKAAPETACVAPGTRRRQPPLNRSETSIDYSG